MSNDFVFSFSLLQLLLKGKMIHLMIQKNVNRVATIKYEKEIIIRRM